ncbi:hypothetical protein ZYGR_0AZ01050 [Zygosaccharomyces rouxii]|uniref:Uncharacterized protein n=1 Tax=Zygosaccharomyces rouxii TaxID=4956 RepID=A0A1Q3AK82_ZYGRO|nr:hypothetical protein ZYGR_0AZ01050 [Zygosaccharomyces rouxii]
MVDQAQVIGTKQFLLDHNPSRIHNDSIFEHFVSGFLVLFDAFKHQTEGMVDSQRLLIIDTFSIWVLRSTQCLANKKIDTTVYMNKLRQELLTTENSGIIFQYVIDFWTDGTATFTNALREMFSKLLRLLNMVYLTQDRMVLFNSWLTQILAISSTLRVQYYLIDSLSPETDLYVVLERKPGFVENSLALMWSDSLSNPIGKCITSLLINIYRIHFKENESSLDEWLELWQDSALKYLQDVRFAKPTELYILIPLFRAMPREAFVKFIQRSASFDASLLISLFRIGQELGIEEEPYHNDKLISLSTVESLLQQDEYKLYAFELLTFSIKTSRPVNSYIYEIIKRNLRIFFVDTKIETRNYFCSALKHFILRIRDSTYSLNRDRNKLIKARKFPEEQIEKLDQIKESQEFLEWLLAFLKTQICPGTQYQRNTLTFKILVILLESGIDKSTPEKYLDLRNFRPYPFSIGFFEDEVLLRLLIDNLTNNYDDIRQTAKKLLTIAFDNDASNSMKDNFNWEKLHQRAIEYLEVYQNTDIGAALQDFLFSTCGNRKKFVEDLLDELQKKIEESKKDYLKHQDDPVGGYFAALTLILRNNEFDTRFSEAIIAKCISLILSNWDAVKEPVCRNPSEAKVSEGFSKGDISDQFITAKAFRSIKESSLLLEVLVTRASVTFEQLKSSGDLMITQLFNLRHSGAFQSVLPSFIACCTKVSADYPAQLEEWLKIVLDSLEVKTQMVTRRSGGIPSLLTTILAAERGKERPLLKFAFETLERVASLPAIQYLEKIDLPQVNAFNCIRSIFVESKLSEPCAPYIASALNLSLKHFTSDIYALRNCSLMLFTSLQNRIFGKAGKSISARLFFTRYRGVREVLLEVLENSLKKPSNNGKGSVLSQSHVESIFLVLNLLLRLRPTPGYDGLNIFIEKIIDCLESTHWNIREMAAKTISSLTDDPLSQCEALLRTAFATRQNKLHGHLLAVKAMMSDKREALEEKNAGARLFELLYSMELLSTNPCFAISKEYIEAMEFVLSWKSTIADAKRDFVARLGNFFLYHNEHYSIDGTKQLCLSAALRTLLVYEKSENIQPLCELGVLSPFYEVQETAVNYVVDSLDLNLSCCKHVAMALKTAFLEDKFRPSLKGPVLRALRETDHLFDFDTIKHLILEPTNEDLQLCAIETLGYVVDSDNMEFMNDIIQKHTRDDMPVDFRMASLSCLRSFSRRNVEPKALLQLHKMLSDDDDEVRECAAESLNKALLGGRKHVKSPSVTGALFGENYVGKFHGSSEAAQGVVECLKEFMNSYDVCNSTTKSIIEGLFEVEKDNQFRNEIEENIQRINILRRMSYSCEELGSWINNLIDRHLKFLVDTKVVDGPLGWASNPEIFSRICILRILSRTYLPAKSLELEGLLRDHNIHPMIFEYLPIDF